MRSTAEGLVTDVLLPGPADVAELEDPPGLDTEELLEPAPVLDTGAAGGLLGVGTPAPGLALDRAAALLFAANSAKLPLKTIISE